MVRPAQSALVRDVHKLVRAAGGRAGERYSQVCKLPDRRELVQAARALAHAGVHSAGRRSAVYRQRQLRRSRCDSRKCRREHGLYHRGQLHERDGRAPREKTRRQHPRLRDAAVRQHRGQRIDDNSGKAARSLVRAARRGVQHRRNSQLGQPHHLGLSRDTQRCGGVFQL